MSERAGRTEFRHYASHACSSLSGKREAAACLLFPEASLCSRRRNRALPCQTTRPVDVRVLRRSMLHETRAHAHTTDFAGVCLRHRRRHHRHASLMSLVRGATDGRSHRYAHSNGRSAEYSPLSREQSYHFSRPSYLQPRVTSVDISGRKRHQFASKKPDLSANVDDEARILP